MSGRVVARVDHGLDNRALLLETLSFVNVVLPQVDLKIPGREEKGGGLTFSPWAAAETPDGVAVGSGVAWYTPNYQALFPSVFPAQ